METDLTSILQALMTAAKSGSWMYALAVMLMAATWAFRKYLAPRYPFFSTDPGGVLLTVALSLSVPFFGALAAAFGAGTPLTWALVVASFKISVAAMGGYAGLKKAVWPALVKLAGWALGKLGFKTAAQKIAEAEAAGRQALASKPSAGSAGATRAPRDVP